MLKKWFATNRSENRRITAALYGEIVAAARQPVFYAEWGVSDTPLGRYEMLTLHMFLLLHRLRGGGEGARDVSQDLTDEFFRDVEHSLRELGVGDQGVPRRMKKLARMFYGRAAAYGAAIDAGDRVALADAFGRNVWSNGEGSPAHAGALAAYAAQAWEEISAQPAAALLAGRLSFPAAATEEAVSP